MSRARYSWTRHGRIIVIVDKRCELSVTNDIEAVVRHFDEWGVDVDAHRIIYRDTLGYYDAILTANREFLGFMSLGGICCLDQAIREAALRTKWG